MGFHQRRHSQGIGNLNSLPDFSPVQKRADQQNCRSPQNLCLVDHIRVHGKIFAQHRNGTLTGNLFQVSVAALKIFRLRQTGNGVRSCLLIFRSNLQIRKLRCNDPFGRGRLLHFADKGKIRLSQCRFKRKSSLPSHAFRLSSEQFRRFPDFFLFHPAPGRFRQFL